MIEVATVNWRRILRRYWPLLLILVLAALWWPALNYLADFRTPDVLFITTPHDIVEAMLDLAEVNKNDVVYDLGSGDGRVLMAAARSRGARAVGIELEPELVDGSRVAIEAAGLSDKIKVIRGDIFKVNIQDATVVTMYLKPMINVRLRSQLDTLHPGTRIVSHQWSMKGAKPRKKIEVHSNDSKMDHPLYLWVTPITWE
jgi:SAM-dependent methyltransferase